MPVNNRRKRNPGTVNDTAPGFGDETTETPDIEGMEDDSTESEHESYDIPNGMPKDLADDLFDNGLSKEYTHTLYKISDGTGKTKKGKLELCGKLDNRYPDVDEIGSEFGSGEYKRYVAWKDSDERGNSVPRLRIVSISIGGNYDAVAARKKIERNRELATLAAPSTGFSATEGVNLLAQLTQLLPKPDNSMTVVIPAMMQMMMEANRMAVEQSNRNTQMMLELIRSEKKQDSFAEELAKYKAIAEMITPPVEKPSMMEQLMEHGKDLLIAYAPVIQDAVSKLNNPLLAPIAKKRLSESEEFQQLLSSEQGKAALIEHVYATQPVEKADNALLKAGVITPEQTRAGKS